MIGVLFVFICLLFLFVLFAHPVTILCNYGVDCCHGRIFMYVRLSDYFSAIEFVLYVKLKQVFTPIILV